MITLNLQYGILNILVESTIPITIPLPLEHSFFPSWIPPMQLKIRVYPLEKYSPNCYEKDVPPALSEFYNAMKILKINCLTPQQHCNSWWKEADKICGFFPYETDNFYLEILPGKLQVTIYGTEINLNRVILDILSCFSTLPPLHGAAVRIGQRTVILLGESGCGKTRILKHLLKRGCIYIADEEIFWIDDKIFCCGRVVVEKSRRPHFYPTKYLEANMSSPVNDVFLLTSNTDFNPSPVLFPIVARQSFWAQSLIDSQKSPKMIERLSVANDRYSQMLRFAKKIKIDHARIYDGLYNIENG